MKVVEVHKYHNSLVQGLNSQILLSVGVISGRCSVSSGRSICPSIHPSPSVRQSPSVLLSHPCVTICLSITVSLSVTVCPSIHPSVCPSIHLSARPSPSIHLSVHQSLSICLSVHLSLSVRPSFHPSVTVHPNIIETSDFGSYNSWHQKYVRSSWKFYSGKSYVQSSERYWKFLMKNVPNRCLVAVWFKIETNPGTLMTIRCFFSQLHNYFLSISATNKVECICFWQVPLKSDFPILTSVFLKVNSSPNLEAK